MPKAPDEASMAPETNKWRYDAPGAIRQRVDWRVYIRELPIEKGEVVAPSPAAVRSYCHRWEAPDDLPQR